MSPFIDFVVLMQVNHICKTRQLTQHDLSTKTHTIKSKKEKFLNAFKRLTNDLKKYFKKFVIFSSILGNFSWKKY